MTVEGVRFAPRLALPTTAFVPGREGSSRPAPITLPARALPPGMWRENEAWLFGADLWNHGFVWEAHEAWELVWRSPFDARQAEFVRGMIQCAAAASKIASGALDSATKLARTGTHRIESAAHDERYMGLDARSFSSAFLHFTATRPVSIDARPRIELR